MGHKPTRRRAIRAAVIVAVTATLVTGCSDDNSGSQQPDSPSPSAGRNTAAPPTSGPGSPQPGPSKSAPSGGRTLAALGISNGPRNSFTIPDDATVTAESDQPSLVEIAVNRPKPQQMDRYLRRALPATGYQIEKHRDSRTTPAISFTGHGWAGKFTGHGSTSGVTLRPAG